MQRSDDVNFFRVHPTTLSLAMIKLLTFVQVDSCLQPLQEQKIALRYRASILYSLPSIQRSLYIFRCPHEIES
jgi:hypothetical protein